MAGGLAIIIGPKKIKKPEGNAEESPMKTAAKDLLEAIKSDDADQVAEILSAIQDLHGSEGESEGD